MDIRLIKAPSPGVMRIIRARSGVRWGEDFCPAAVGLVQGKLIEMLVASDIAEKTAGVTVSDIRGACPQHMVCLAVAGDTAEIMECLARIERGGGEARGGV